MLQTLYIQNSETCYEAMSMKFGKVACRQDVFDANNVNNSMGLKCLETWKTPSNFCFEDIVHNFDKGFLKERTKPAQRNTSE